MVPLVDLSEGDRIRILLTNLHSNDRFISIFCAPSFYSCLSEGRTHSFTTDRLSGCVFRSVLSTHHRRCRMSRMSNRFLSASRVLSQTSLARQCFFLSLFLLCSTMALMLSKEASAQSACDTPWSATAGMTASLGGENYAWLKISIHRPSSIQQELSLLISATGRLINSLVRSRLAAI
jgi:hypothetical protein